MKISPKCLTDIATNLLNAMAKKFHQFFGQIVEAQIILWGAKTFRKKNFVRCCWQMIYWQSIKWWLIVDWWRGQWSLFWLKGLNSHLLQLLPNKVGSLWTMNYELSRPFRRPSKNNALYIITCSEQENKGKREKRKQMFRQK